MNPEPRPPRIPLLRSAQSERRANSRPMRRRAKFSSGTSSSAETEAFGPLCEPARSILGSPPSSAEPRSSCAVSRASSFGVAAGIGAAAAPGLSSTAAASSFPPSAWVSPGLARGQSGKLKFASAGFGEFTIVSEHATTPNIEFNRRGRQRLGEREICEDLGVIASLLSNSRPDSREMPSP